MMKKQYHFTIWVLAVALFAFACNSPVSKSNEGMYFDVQGFVFSEIQRLNKIKPGLTKTIVVNNNDPETVALDSADWSKELQFFNTIDLNRENLKNQYDTASDGNKNLLIKRFTAKDSTLAVQEVEITYDKGKVVLLTAVTKKRSWIVDRDSKYSYQPGNGYSLTVKEDFFWKKPGTTEIFVQIKNPDHLIY